MFNYCLAPVITIALNTVEGSNVNFEVCFLLESVYLSHLLLIYSVFSSDFYSKRSSKEKHALVHSFRFLLILLTKIIEN